MAQALREIEGTWEEIAAQGADFAGQRVRLILLDTTAREDEKVVIPQRPEPTPDEARLGIRPPAIGTGRAQDITRFVQSLPPEDRSDGLWEVIAENRAMRRQLAEERG